MLRRPSKRGNSGANKDAQTSPTHSDRVSGSRQSRRPSVATRKATATHTSTEITVVCIVPQPISRPMTTAPTTQAGPANSTMILILYIYFKAFRDFDMSYAAALAWALFLMVLILTAANFALARWWVHYEGGDAS